MLCLDRRKGEKFAMLLDGQQIGTIEWVDRHGDKVRFGFELDQRIRIVRQELLERDHAKHE
jgi:sRNA-binding carbon storage regulator CsrA